MKRHQCQPRADWIAKVESVGLTYHSHENGPYWDESACYELTAAEVRHLMAKEWARFPDDILWRRSKLGLTMPSGDRDALAAFMAASA